MNGLERDQLDTLRSEFNAGLSAIRGELQRMREDHAAMRGSNEAQWATHRELHRGFEQARHEERIRALEDWQVELRSYGRLLRYTFGASALAAVVSVAALVQAIAG